MSDDGLSYRFRDHPGSGANGNACSHVKSPAWLRITMALAIGIGILILPSNPADFSSLPLPPFPLEILGLVLAAVLLPCAAFRIFRPAATVILALILFLKLADIGTGLAFQRPFNPYLDFKVIRDGWNLLSGSLGRFEAAALTVAAFSIWLLVVASLFWSLRGFRTLSSSVSRILAAALSACLAVGMVALTVSTAPPVSADVAAYLANRVSLMHRSIADLSAFERELASDPLDSLSPPQHFSQLAEKDVIFIFVESYGRSALENPSYASRIQARLQEMDRGISSMGLEARSGWLTSPTVGGLSWLAHGALLSGLWTDNQARYDRMIASRRLPVNALFRNAGWQTTAIMPAITMDWPESAYFGYDTVRDATGLGYRGKPFNWVTMPDQYTLSAFERLDRPTGHRPVMAEIALISSHAPWTPVPTLVGWNSIGDGRVFNSQADAGDPPSAVWSDPERIRIQYLASIDYVLQTLSSYIARHGDDTLFVLLGDHQPAAVVTGEGASRDVPMHIIGPAALLDQISDWGWSNGMIPAAELPPLRMDLFREKFVRSFSDVG